jgi:hypothetical protein
VRVRGSALTPGNSRGSLPRGSFVPFERDGPRHVLFSAARALLVVGVTGSSAFVLHRTNGILKINRRYGRTRGALGKRCTLIGQRDILDDQFAYDSFDAIRYYNDGQRRRIARWWGNALVISYYEYCCEHFCSPYPPFFYRYHVEPRTGPFDKRNIFLFWSYSAGPSRVVRANLHIAPSRIACTDNDGPPRVINHPPSRVHNGYEERLAAARGAPGYGFNLFSRAHRT